MMTHQKPQIIQRWHKLIADQDTAGLGEILADEVVFYSPVVFSPQKGKSITRFYLTAAFNVLAGDNFRYVRELYGKWDAVLEFETEIDGVVINGVDLIKWDEHDRIIEFKVMVRPLKAVNQIHQAMGVMLQQMQGKEE